MEIVIIVTLFNMLLFKLIIDRIFYRTTLKYQKYYCIISTIAEESTNSMVVASGHELFQLLLVFYTIMSICEIDNS